VKVGHRKKREKVSALLFDLVKYLLTVMGVGAILPESKISIGTALVGMVIAFVILTLALVITPEETE
jgi:small-conductance mechanosensitive channel